MIFKLSTSSSRRHDDVRDAVLQPIRKFFPYELASRRDHLVAVASGVADYVCAEVTTAAKGPDLTLLTTRALSATGERELARRLLVLAKGLARRSDWAVAGGNGIWIVDLARLEIGQDDALELTLFASLRHVLVSVAEELQDSGGRGVLGLKNLAHASAAVVGSHSGRDFRFADEVRNYCRDWFARETYTWDHVPHVVRLD